MALGLNDENNSSDTDMWSDNAAQKSSNDDLWPSDGAASAAEETPFVPEPYTPPSEAESARRMGLAYSIGLVFFISIVFMMLLGWGADLILGSKPWGLVGGVILGAVIGFIQIFRITSQIFAKDPAKHQIKPLLSRDDHE